MNRAIIFVAALFLGPLISLFLGGLVYLFLSYGLGAAANSEGTATKAEQYFNSIASTVASGIILAGVILSLLIAISATLRPQTPTSPQRR